MWKISVLCLVVALAGCKKKDAPGKEKGKSELRSGLSPPPPPIGSDTVAGALEIPSGSKGAGSAEALVRAIVDAATKRDRAAFMQLVLSAGEIALAFHPGVQDRTRNAVGTAAARFDRYAKQIGKDAQFTAFNRGLRIDFRNGQGAKQKMPGYLNSSFVVTQGGAKKTFRLNRMVQIGKVWKVLEL